MRRILLLAAALSIPLAGASLALSSGTAGASSGPKGKTVCSTLSGTITGNITISGCVDANGANTGGGTTLVATSLATGGTVTWNSGFTSHFQVPVLTATSAKHCPGYVKGAMTEPTADKVTGVVDMSTAGFKIPGKFTGEVCINGINITNPKPLKVS